MSTKLSVIKTDHLLKQDKITFMTYKQISETHTEILNRQKKQCVMEVCKYKMYKHTIKS